MGQSDRRNVYRGSILDFLLANHKNLVPSESVDGLALR